jgi:ribonucleotide reductase beta subunit family protein with ferritin-like domain
MSLLKFAKTYKPFSYEWAMEAAVNHEKIHWHEEEIELGDDITQWEDGTLTDKEKNFVTQILKLFTQSDVQVGANYCDLFIPVFKNNEVRQMLLSFASREGVHQRAYALLNDTLGLPDKVYSEFLEYEAMSDKMEMMQDNDVSTSEGIAKAVAQTVCNEGMSLFSSFVMLLNFQRYGKMKGMCKITEWSLRDETEHVLGMSKLFKEYCKENPSLVTDELKRSIYQKYRDAVDLEDKFIDLVADMGLPEGLTIADMKAYIRFIANRRLNMIGLKDNWSGVTNPFPWLDWILGEGHTNFFEQRVSEYSVGGLKGEWVY